MVLAGVLLTKHYSGLGLEKFVLVFDPTEHTTPARVQAKMHGKKRAGVVCFSLKRKKEFASPWRLYSVYNALLTKHQLEPCINGVLLTNLEYVCKSTFFRPI